MKFSDYERMRQEREYLYRIRHSTRPRTDGKISDLLMEYEYGLWYRLPDGRYIDEEDNVYDTEEDVKKEVARRMDNEKSMMRLLNGSHS
jgi:hypothetical protein